MKLEKQLASEEQLSQLSSGGGTVISQPAKQADRIAAQSRRNPADIQKVSSDANEMIGTPGAHIRGPNGEAIPFADGVRTTVITRP